LIYFDSSLVVRLYFRESGWRDVAARVNSLDEPLPLVFLHDIEVVNAFHRGVYEGAVSPKQRDASLELFASDIADGLYRRIALDLGALTKRAVEISETWTAKMGGRSLDVLHVAAAENIGAGRFLTGDIRQRKLARAIGLATS
jgi:predicted nucleic acid-binding protein